MRECGTAHSGVHRDELRATIGKDDRLREARMSTTDVQNRETGRTAARGSVDLKLEVVVIPVADADRSREFYAGLGWRLDADFSFDNGFRVVQFTPPGSLCSIQFGTKITAAAPGSAPGLYLVVSDLDAARRGTHPSRSEGERGVPRGRAGGAAPARRHERSRERSRSGWEELQLLCHVRGSGRERLVAAGDHRPVARTGRPVHHVVQLRQRLGERLRRAAAAHGEHEKRIGKADPDWPDWYATFMVAEQAGAELPS